MTFVLKLKLKTTGKTVRELNERFFIVNRCHNLMVTYANHRLNDMKRSKEYHTGIKTYAVARKGLSGLKKGTPEYDEADAKRKAAGDALNEIYHKFGIDKSSLEKFAAIFQNKHKTKISSHQMQKEADVVYKGVSDVLYGKGRKLHYKRLVEQTTISQENDINGVKFYDGYITWGGYKDDTKNMLRIPYKVPDAYAQEALLNEVKYCEITRIEFSDGWHYYVNVYLDGTPPVKFNHGKGTTGIDLGVSTVAAVNESGVMLEELAPDYCNYDRKIKALQRKIDRSMRASNPDNYNDDGTIKKGRKTWHLSKNCKTLKRKVRILYRKQTAYTETKHREQINCIIRQSDTVIMEPVNWAALIRRSKKKNERQDKTSVITKKNGDTQTVHKYKRRKRFGRSIRNRSPGMFAAFLFQKCNTYHITYLEVDTKKFRASQLNHMTGKYQKCPLTQRTKQIGDDIVQRDLYSAFLISNAKFTEAETETRSEAPDLKACNDKFNSFVKIQNEAIAEMKKLGISYKPCFGF